VRLVPPAPLPSELVEFLLSPHPAVVASLRPDGWPHTVATWYDWDDGHVLLNMDESRLRLRFMQDDPRVALTVLEDGNWYRHVSLRGRIVRIEADTALRDIDRLAIRYSGSPFGRRGARRYSAWMGVESWHAWDDSGPWLPR
jgi:PPOX class probable F420-dependent enzyme